MPRLLQAVDDRQRPAVLERFMDIDEVDPDGQHRPPPRRIDDQCGSRQGAMIMASVDERVRDFLHGRMASANR
jgi:hypothetical protein